MATDVIKAADKSSKQKWIPDRYAHAFQEALDSYERAHPHWRIEVLVSLIKWGIRNLKHSIESEPDGQVTWDEPFIELHYSVEWDWKAPRDGDVLYGKQVIGKFTKENTSDRKAAAQTLAKMMACRLNTMALGDFTNGAWFEKRANKHIPYLPAKFDSAVKQMKGKWKKREALEELFRPFSIGATRIDISGDDLDRNGRIPRNVAKQLEAIGERMDIPGVSFNGSVNGRKIWSGLVFEIQPLTVDYDTQRAFHAVTIGLAFERRLVGDDVISLTPAGWPRRAREKFWNEFFRGIDAMTERLIPKDESRSSIVLLHNDEILQVQSLHCRADLKVAKEMFAGFQTKRQKAEAIAKQRKELLRLLEACDRAKSADEKGRTLERLAAELFNTVPGFRVVKSRVRTQTEEIDLVVSHTGKAHGFKNEEEFILVECKKWSAKCGKDEFVLFEKKIRNRKGRSSLGFLVSWNGFADTLTKEMLRGSHERLLIVPLDGNQIRSAVQKGTFLSLLKSAKQKAVFV